MSCRRSLQAILIATVLLISSAARGPGVEAQVVGLQRGAPGYPLGELEVQVLSDGLTGAPESRLATESAGMGIADALAGAFGIEPVVASSPSRALQDEPQCVWVPLEVGGEVAGTSQPPDCRWGQLMGTSDPTYVDQYLVRFASRTKLTAALDGTVPMSLQLRDMTFAPVAWGASDGESPATMTATVPAGEYLLLARPAEATSGLEAAYTLATSGEAQPEPGDCAPGTLTPGEGIEGSLDAGGCRIFDYLEHVVLDSLGELYEVELTAPGILDLSMTTSGYPPLLSVLTDDLLFAIETDASGGDEDPDPEASAISIHLGAGRYYVLAAASRNDGEGAFTLSSTFTPALGKCTGADAILGESYEAELTEDDCRLAYVAPDLADPAPVDIFRLFVPQPGIIRFTLDAESFIPSFRIFDALYQPLIGNRLATGADVSVPFAGELTIAVQSFDDSLGAYTFATNFVPDGEKLCAYQAIAIGEPVTGELTADDCSLSDVASIADATRVDLYRITLPERGRLTVDQRSTEIDSYLWLIGGLFDYNLQSDDTPAGDDSQISAVLPAGSYIILANSTEPAVGAYSLATSFEPRRAPEPCPIDDLPLNTEVTGALGGPAGCLIHDLNETRYSAGPAARYRLELAERGNLTIHAESDGFFPRLRLMDGSGERQLASDVDSTRLFREATIELVLAPGGFMIDVEEASGTPDLTGGFTLRTTFEAIPGPDTCPIVELPGLPALLEGELEPGDCLLPDLLGAGYEQNRVDVYTFTVPQRGWVTANMAADWDILDPYLELHDARFGLLASNNDAVDVFDRDAFIEMEVWPGRYHLITMSADLRSGPYELDAAFDPEPYTVPPTAEPPPTPGPGTPTPDPTGGRIYLPFGRR